MTYPKIPQIMSATGKIDPSLIPQVPPASLDAVTDLNNVLTTGVYLQATTASATTTLHYPVVSAGSLEVFGSTGTLSTANLWQRYTPFQSLTTKTYVRSLTGGTWSAWQAVGENQQAVVLGASLDMNSFTQSGVYVQTSDANAANGANYPVPYAGMMEVTVGPGGWIYQRYTTYLHGDGVTGNRVYHRSLYSGTWSPWVHEKMTAFGSGGTSAPLLTRDIAYYYSGSTNVTGNVVIDTTVPVTSTEMMSVKIQGYNYLQGVSDIDLTVDFYCYAGTPAIINATARSNGTLPVRVRLGVNSSNCIAIILTSQGPSAQWQYPQIVVTQVLTGFGTPASSYFYGWTTRLVAEASIASTFTGIVTPSLYGTTAPNYASIGTNYRSAVNAGRKPLEVYRAPDGFIHMRGTFESAVSISGWSAYNQFPVTLLPSDWLPPYDMIAVGSVTAIGNLTQPVNFILRGSNTSGDYSSTAGSGTLIWQAFSTASFAALAAGQIFWVINDMSWLPA